MPKLIIRQAGQSRDFPIVKDSLSIGRTPENDIEIKDSLISRRHTSIVKKGDKFVVYDLGSSNGTFVNREKIDSKPLVDGDVIRVGDTELFYMENDRAKLPTAPAVLTPSPAQKITDFGGGQQIVERVDQLAQSYSLNINEALSMGMSLKDIRKDSSGEKAAKESKMFFILFQVGKALTSAATLDEMLVIASKLIFEVINGERCVILLKATEEVEATPHMVIHRTRGVIEGKDIHVPKTILKQVVGEKVGIITSDALQDPRFMQGLSIVQYNIRSALCVPLWDEKRVYGAVYLDNLAKTYAFTKDDLELLTAIANLIGIRIRQEEVQAKLRKEETLRANLSKYHSPDHVKLLMDRGGDVGLEVAEREVSVVFIDVEGSTRMAETKDASTVAKLLNEFFLMATNAIFEHNGHVNNFIGDEVMAIFNAPLDMADHAVNAVKACVTFLKERERFCQANPERAFNVRCAVNSGMAVAGNVGTPTHIKYTVLGDTVNVAARLTKFPQVNSIVVGEKTYDLVRNVFKAKDLGETLLKGKEKTLRAYEIQTT